MKNKEALEKIIKKLEEILNFINTYDAKIICKKFSIDDLCIGMKNIITELQELDDDAEIFFLSGKDFKTFERISKYERREDIKKLPSKLEKLANKIFSFDIIMDEHTVKMAEVLLYARQPIYMVFIPKIDYENYFLIPYNTNY